MVHSANVLKIVCMNVQENLEYCVVDVEATVEMLENYFWT